MLYAIKRPDGTIVQAAADMNPGRAWLAASHAERSISKSGEEYRSEQTFGALCWRADNESFSYSPSLAREIGTLLGYRCVPVTLVEVEKGER